MADKKSIGLVKTHSFHSSQSLALEAGDTLDTFTLAYETYGRLDPRGENAILLLHALSGDAHAAGYQTENPEEKPGWWETMVGPGKAFDTDRYFIICSNILGGCKGSTGPSSPNPATGKPYGLRFPMVTIPDMVQAQRRLLEHLGVHRLLAVSGGSMGGMQALQWAVAYPDIVVSVIPIATAARLSAQAIALDAVGRQAILSDPQWMNGDYYGKALPEKGLAIARMIGHITYLSEATFDAKFGRRLQDKDGYSYDFLPEFQVESYLNYKGTKFVERFDANSYLYLTRAVDYFDLSPAGTSLSQTFRNVRSKFLVLSYSSDWLFPPHQSLEIVKALRANHVPVTYTCLRSPYGHDAFLLDNDRQTNLIRNFLDNQYSTERE